MTEIEFYVEGRPRSKGSFVFYKGRIFPQNSKGLYRWTKIIKETARSFKPKDRPMEGVVSIQLDFYFSRPKGGEKRRYFNQAPDIDKLIRAVLDALTGVIYSDDSQVISVSSTKQYTDIRHPNEGVYIRLSF